MTLRAVDQGNGAARLPAGKQNTVSKIVATLSDAVIKYRAGGNPPTGPSLWYSGGGASQRIAFWPEGYSLTRENVLKVYHAWRKSDKDLLGREDVRELLREYPTASGFPDP